MNTKVAVKVSCLCLFFVVGVRFIAADNEFDVVPKLYEEIGCTEIKSDSDSDAKSFKCPDFSTYDINKCYLNGNIFNVGDKIVGEFVPSCRTECRCGKYETAAEINCADIECFGEELEEPKPNCISVYDDLKECCSTSEICDKEKMRSLNTCEVEGRVYHIGERMNLENYKCLCTHGYNNATSHADNPNCLRYNCGMELELNSLRTGCVPVYYKTPNSCSIEYKCPSEDDIIDTQSNPGRAGQTCQFGELKLNVGDKLKSLKKCLSCQCAIPPFITCIQTC